jgi:hypothetical protein
LCSQGALGFWRGVTASYWGISETVIHFVLYEYLKKELADYQRKHKDSEKTLVDFAGFMLCGACSKTCATVVAYPHGESKVCLTPFVITSFNENAGAESLMHSKYECFLRRSATGFETSMNMSCVRRCVILHAHRGVSFKNFIYGNTVP